MYQVVTRRYRDGISRSKYPTGITTATATHASRVTYPGGHVASLIASGTDLEQVAGAVMQTRNTGLQVELYLMLKKMGTPSANRILAAYPQLSMPSTELFLYFLQQNTSLSNPLTTRQIYAKFLKGKINRPSQYRKNINQLLYALQKAKPVTVMGRRGVVRRADPAPGKKAPRWYWEDSEEAEDQYIDPHSMGHRPRYMPLPEFDDYIDLSLFVTS